MGEPTHISGAFNAIYRQEIDRLNAKVAALEKQNQALRELIDAMVAAQTEKVTAKTAKQ